MAIAGLWRAQQEAPVSYVGRSKWGDGTDPLFASRDNGRGRGTAITGTDNPLIDEALTEEFAPEMYGYTDDDVASVIWGNGTQTGTADRPDWSQTSNEYAMRAATSQEFPQWGVYENGIPGGTDIRTYNHGEDSTNTPKVTPDEDVAQGWENKVYGSVDNAQTSDQSQYEMQTSMTQRDKTREGSQNSGTANEFDQPIKSRIPGQRVRQWASSDSVRHGEMFPKQQDNVVRAFYNRTGGTGIKGNMQVNELYVSEPLARTAPENPYQGPQVGDDAAGYTAEDMGVYY